MVAFNGLLPPLEGATLKATLAEMVDAKWRAEHPERAKTEGGHGGDSHEQRMADALAALATGGHNVNMGVVTIKPAKTEATRAANAPTSTDDHESSTQEKQVVVSMPTNLKPSVVINFNVDKWEAEILGVGPIPVTAPLFDMAKNDLYYAFKNMTGEILKFGRARYEPSAIQRLAVLARDRRCIYPDCTVTADLCEIHHLNEWLQDQGFTDVEILGLLCRPHHRHIHTGDLKATRLPDGTVAIHERVTGFLVAIATTRIAIAA